MELTEQHKKTVLELLLQHCRTNVDVTPATTFGELNMDSLDAVEFVIDVEEKLGVEIDDDDWGFDTTVQRVFDDVAKQMSVAP